jgi:hypothetical protein
MQAWAIASSLPSWDLRDPFGLACLAEPVLPAGERVRSGVYSGAPGAARKLLYVTGCDGPIHRPPISVYNPVHGLPAAAIKTAGGAGGARTHDRRIMRTSARRIGCTTCTGTTESRRQWR